MLAGLKSPLPVSLWSLFKIPDAGANVYDIQIESATVAAFFRHLSKLSFAAPKNCTTGSGADIGTV